MPYLFGAFQIAALMLRLCRVRFSFTFNGWIIAMQPTGKGDYTLSVYSKNSYTNRVIYTHIGSLSG
jgi:hypothetical protein